MISSENRVPTETFLLPGQKSCVGLPWERAALPAHGLPVPLPKQGLEGSTLDFDGSQDGDPCAGLEVGPCEVLRRLTPNSARRLLAVRSDGVEPPALVELRRIEGPDGLEIEVAGRAARAALVRHAGLLRVYSSEEADEGVFWVTEHLAGVTVAELLAACRASGKRMPIGFALGLFHDAAVALAALHAGGLFHGLLSDHGVGLTFGGEARLRDVGIFRCVARRESWAEVLEPMEPYLAPEQLLRGQLPDAKTDVFSLATLLYDCLTERSRRVDRPDDFVPPSRFSVALPMQVDEVLLAALARDRARRTATAADFARALKQASQGLQWKPEQCAAFIAVLFPTRLRREAVLAEGLADFELPPLPVAAPTVAVEMPAVEEPLVVLPVLVPALPEALLRPAAQEVVGSRPPRRLGHLLALAASTLAAGLCVWTCAAALPLPEGPLLPAPWALVIAEPERAEAPPEPVAPRVRAPVEAALAPQPAAGAATAAEDEPAPLTPVTPAPIVSAAKRRRPPARARSDDTPLPPWLAHGKRGRR